MESFDERAAAALFTREPVAELQSVNTARGEADFREAVIVRLASGERIVVKAAANPFTTEESIRMWQRCAGEYRALGYYCPRIMAALDGSFPSIRYKGKDCVVYAEEFSKYETADRQKNVKPFRDALYRMTAQVARRRYDYTSLPSGYCLFELFPGDTVDEVSENVIAFRDYCRTLPEPFPAQAERMYVRWQENRSMLRELYFRLPFSVYQADFNDTNVLVDEDGNFAGIRDFNLAGRDELLNYLFREIFTGTFEQELSEILHALRVVSESYAFSEEEIQAAPLVYRCVKPLFFARVDTLKSAGNDTAAIRDILNEMEYAQTREIDFRSAMQG